MTSPRNHQGLILYSLLIILSVFISGCVTLPDPEVSQDIQSDLVGVINDSHTVGQTIELRRNGFNGLTFRLAGNGDESNLESLSEPLLHVDIYSLSEPTTLIYHSALRLSNTADSQSINLSLPPQHDSAGRKYSVQLSTDSGSIKVFGRNEDIYPQGQTYLDQIPKDADITFSTTYEYNFSFFIEDVISWTNNINLTPAFFIVLILPGWLLSTFFITQLTSEFGQRIGISIGLSLAIIPVLLLWTSTFGISWTRNTVLFLCGFISSVFAFIFFNSHTPKNLLNELKNWIVIRNTSGLRKHTYSIREYSSKLVIPILLLSIFSISLSVRLIMIRDLATPAWVDSIHHALITRIILETGTLPETYFPYLDIEANSYHPGFHSQLATFKLLTDLSIPNSMLVFGQVLNASMVFLIFAFSRKLTQSNLSALFAALITGLFTPMPAYYTSWGRYTQLSGLLILPVAYILFTNAISRADNNIKKVISLPLVIAAIAASGLFLVHYRVAAFFILLIIAELFISFIFIDQHQKSPRQRIIFLICYTLLCILLLLPWLIRAVPDTFIPGIARPAEGESTWFSDFSWRYLSAALGKQALVLGGLGLLWGLITKKRFAFLLLIWIGLLLILANLSVLGLPGGGLINTTSIEISLFIPISIFGGYFLNEAINLWKAIIPSKTYPILSFGIIFSGIFIAFVGAKNITPILNPVTFLSRHADLAAIQWVEENIPSNESILINPFLWGYGLYAGNDGGAWITPIAGRRTVPPPVLYALSTDDTRKLINQISQFVIDHGNDADGLHAFLTSKGIHYIYTGSRGGPISPQALLDNSGYKSLYDSQGVRIFEILP